MATKKNTRVKSTDRYVLIATSSRPWTVVAGYLESEEEDGWFILRDARMIVYWTTDSRALFGVASRGLQGRGRVTQAVSRVRIRNVETVLEVSPQAKSSIEAEPWT